jgi:hypothetical protein
VEIEYDGGPPLIGPAVAATYKIPLNLARLVGYMNMKDKKNATG